MNPANITCETLRQSCAKFATGITIVTVVTPDGAPHGLTVNSFTSVSCEPPIVSVCIDLKCSILPALLSTEYLGINVLSEGQQDISVRFAASTEPRFEGIPWSRGATGVPILNGVLTAFECRRHSDVVVGDHRIILAEVELVECFGGDRPLLYFNSRYARVAP